MKCLIITFIFIFFLLNESMNEFLNHFYVEFHIDIEAKSIQTFFPNESFCLLKLIFMFIKTTFAYNSFTFKCLF
jgi:hypothetical protein